MPIIFLTCQLVSVFTCYIFQNDYSTSDLKDKTTDTLLFRIYENMFRFVILFYCYCENVIKLKARKKRTNQFEQTILKKYVPKKFLNNK